MTEPSLSRMSLMTWGFMITPPLAMPPATIAISSGVACTSFWPIDAWASAGRLRVKSLGNAERAGAGRSIGGFWLKPNDWVPEIMASGPIVSVPISVNAELQDTRRIGTRVPPQDSPPKLLIDLFVWGGV